MQLHSLQAHWQQFTVAESRKVLLAAALPAIHLGHWGTDGLIEVFVDADAQGTVKLSLIERKKQQHENPPNT